MKQMTGRGANWRPMTQEPAIEPGTDKKLLITWNWEEVEAMTVARDWEGNLHWNAFYTFSGELSSTSEIKTDCMIGWMYMPEPKKDGGK